MSHRTIAFLALVALCAANPVRGKNLEHDDPIGFNVGKHMSKGVVDTPDLFFIFYFSARPIV